MIDQTHCHLSAIVDTRDKLLVTRRDVEPTNAIARALRPA